MVVVWAEPVGTGNQIVDIRPTLHIELQSD
jgi:hypothetical protein